MTRDHEDLSLKILRILYHLEQQNLGSQLALDALEERFNLLEVDEDRTRVRQLLPELLSLGLIQEVTVKKSPHYAITEKGISHYEKFKYFIDDSSQKADVYVQGDWYGNNHHHTQCATRCGTVHFPSETEEFIQHYDELLEGFERIEGLVMDSPNGETILEELTKLKAVINQDSSAFGGKVKWEKRLEDLFQRIEGNIQ
ncbi:MAG: hypothetical protein IEMM0008_1827 [bacterium]|nr:MAG: hypothetical protein IEMM0008_1827 [bacterium]